MINAPRRLAFTLVELLAALVIVALLVGAASVSLRGVLARTRLEDAVGRVENFDRLTREQSRRGGSPLRIRLRSGGDQLHREAAGTGAPVGAACLLPPGVVVADVLGLGGRRGDVVIPCSARGLTPSYAMRIGTDNGASRWVVVAGLTGKVTVFDDDDDAAVRNIFALLDAPTLAGDDAD